MEYEWLPMSDELHDQLWSWWKTRPIKDTPYALVSTSNRHYEMPFTTRRRFMKGLCERAGVKTFGFHSLRRYVASVPADTHKVSAKTIQRILCHKNVTTTERYIQNINRDLGATMNLLSEKGYQTTQKG
jgi:integrase